MKKLNIVLVVVLVIVLFGCDSQKINLSKSEIQDNSTQLNNDVNLSVSVIDVEKISITLTNSSTGKIEYEYSVFLEKNIDGIWYALTEKAAYADEDFILEPNDQFNQTIELKNWDETSSGTFRIYKEITLNSIQQICISNKFEIKKH